MVTPAEKGQECEEDGCGAWAMDNGKCYHCGGQNWNDPPEPEEGNLRAMKHGAYASPEFIRQGIENGHPKLQEYQDMYTAFFEALCTQHEQVYGAEPNDFFKSRYRRFVTFDIMERLIEDYMTERQGSAQSDNPLVEEQIEDVDGRMNVEKANKLLQRLSEWSREIRLGMKDYGLLHDPESKKAQAQEDLASLWAEELEN
jgi:hypothetical protein